MRIICPVCEIWLVDVYLSGGEGNFWCLGYSEAHRKQLEQQPKGAMENIQDVHRIWLIKIERN
jgi:hypothetical protein